MSARDHEREWQAIKSDPIRYAAYLERKRHERRAKPWYETARKKKWRLANPGAAQRIREANHAVETELDAGRMQRPDRCSNCQAVSKVEAHHYKGYSPEHWLDILWLCVFCHRKADAGLISER